MNRIFSVISVPWFLKLNKEHIFLFRLFRVFGSRLTMPTWDHIQLRQMALHLTNCWYTPVLYTPTPIWVDKSVGHYKMKQTLECLHQHIYRITTLVWQLLPSNWSGLRCISFQIHEKTSMNPWYIHLIFFKSQSWVPSTTAVVQYTQVVEIKDVTSHKQKKLKFGGLRYIHDILFTSGNAHK